MRYNDGMDKEIVLATPMAIEQPQPWNRQPDESSYWYDAFLLYRNLPSHSRSIMEAYRRYKQEQGCTDLSQVINASGDWYRQCNAMDWEKRATLYDDYIRRQVQEQAEQAVKDWYAQSRFDLVKMWDGLQVDWDEAGNDDKMSKSQVIAATKTLTQQLTPTSPTQSIDIKIILDKLPSDVQTALLDTLSSK